jgi:hypothetical protein
MLFLEVEAGRRPRRQLAPLLAPLLYTRLAGIWHRGGAPGAVESVRIVGLEGPRCDAVVMVRRGPRRGAIAVQLVRGRNGWRIEDLARPEDRALPPAPFPVADGDTEDDGAGEIPLVVVGADRTQMTRSPRSG